MEEKQERYVMELQSTAALKEKRIINIGRRELRYQYFGFWAEKNILTSYPLETRERYTTDQVSS